VSFSGNGKYEGELDGVSCSGSRVYEGEFYENRKSAIKIRNTARLSVS
jgi:hypothetical protein